MKDKELTDADVIDIIAKNMAAVSGQIREMSSAEKEEMVRYSPAIFRFANELEFLNKLVIAIRTGVAADERRKYEYERA